MGKSLYFELGEHFLSQAEVEFIERELKSFPLESITIGDAGEINNCQVGRLMEDQPQCIPRLMNEDLSSPILNLYRSERARAFFSPYLSKPAPQFIRRSQFNLLQQGSYVGRHLDIDSNPDYQIAVVLQLGSKFTGGEFAVYFGNDNGKNGTQIIAPSYGSITISFCNSEHEVKMVRSGVRTSLVMFISNDNLANKRER